MLTRDENQTDDLIRRLQKEVDREYPQAQILFAGIDQGPPVDAPLEVRLYGPSTQVLKTLGETFRQRLAALPDVTHTKVSMAPAPPKVMFDLDESALKRAGLSKAEVARGIESALKGRIGGELLEGTERLPVRAILAREEWDSTDDLTNIRIPVGAPTLDTLVPAVPLSALGSVSLIPDESPIARKNGDRLNNVQGFLKRGVLPEEALKMLAADLETNPIPLPTGYYLEFGGDSQERGELVEDLMAPLGTILAAMLATILLTFNSWRLTGIAFGVTGCSLAKPPRAGSLSVSAGNSGAHWRDRLGGRLHQRRDHYPERAQIERSDCRRARRDRGCRDGCQSAHCLNHGDNFRWLPAPDPRGEPVLATFRHGDRRRRAALNHCLFLFGAAALHASYASSPSLPATSP